jgi:SAM-dependent methyltransferase
LLFAQYGAVVTGFDISEESVRVAHARARAIQTGLPFMPLFQVKNIEELPEYPGRGGPYDLVHSFGVLHHTPHPDRVLTGLKGWFKPGGELRLMLYNRYSWKAFWILAKYGKMQFWRWAELVQRYSEAQEGSPWTTTWTPRLAGKLLTQTGYDVRSMKVDHIFPYRVEDYRKGNYVQEWQWRLMGPTLFHWLERRIGWHLMVCATPMA